VRMEIEEGKWGYFPKLGKIRHNFGPCR